MRSGTLATHQIVGMGEAARLAQEEIQEEAVRVGALRDRFWSTVSPLGAVQINGSMQHHLPGALNLGVDFVDGEVLLMALKGLAISTGSACTSASLEPSYVLRALGVPDALAHSSLRFSFGRFTTEAQVDEAAAALVETVSRLRNDSPAWEQYQAENAG